MTFFLEVSQPFQIVPGSYNDRTMRRFWFAWFAFGWTRIPFREFVTTAYDWKFHN